MMNADSIGSACGDQKSNSRFQAVSLQDAVNEVFGAILQIKTEI